MSTDSKTHLHDCKDHYELKDYKKPFDCDGCKMKGQGERYHCNLCGNELHKECKNPRATISHEYFPGSTFAFRDEPFTRLGRDNRREFSKCCNACGKDICGFSYHCEADNLDLHPYCSKLRKTLSNDDMVLDLQEKVSSKCTWCKSRRLSGGDRKVPGWSYVSACKKYHFHVHCVTEIAHEACMNDGEMGLEKAESRQLAGSSRDRGGRSSKVFQTIKTILKIILAALLGDPTVLISNAFVELVSRGLE